MPDSEYVLEKAASDNEAFFSFIGHFQQSSVTWHVHLITCRLYRPHCNADQHTVKQFIEIEKGRQAGHYQARICLNIPRIDHAAIIKTMIMMRQYKKLALGRHEYGEALQLSADK